MTVYRKNRVIKRTVLWPVRWEIPWGRFDPQTLPPVRWCKDCGMEVYGEGERCRWCERLRRADRETAVR